jgi:hypothetical protein
MQVTAQMQEMSAGLHHFSQDKQIVFPSFENGLTMCTTVVDVVKLTGQVGRARLGHEVDS